MRSEIQPTQNFSGKLKPKTLPISAMAKERSVRAAAAKKATKTVEEQSQEDIKAIKKAVKSGAATPKTDAEDVSTKPARGKKQAKESDHDETHENTTAADMAKS